MSRKLIFIKDLKPLTALSDDFSFEKVVVYYSNKLGVFSPVTSETMLYSIFGTSLTSPESVDTKSRDWCLDLAKDSGALAVRQYDTFDDKSLAIQYFIRKGEMNEARSREVGIKPVESLNPNLILIRDKDSKFFTIGHSHHDSGAIKGYVLYNYKEEKVAEDSLLRSPNDLSVESLIERALSLNVLNPENEIYIYDSIKELLWDKKQFANYWSVIEELDRKHGNI